LTFVSLYTLLVRRRNPANKSVSSRSADHAPQVGLARAISKLGYCSRSQAAELIQAGHVRLNGVVRRNPETPVAFGRDKIEVRGSKIEAAQKTYWMLNKPRGVVTTASDEKGRSTVYDFIQEAQWLAPVGRLDKASEGLLLLTNDSEWAARISAPETHLPKTYHVQIAAIADDRLLEVLLKGVRARNELLSAMEANLLRQGQRNSWLEIVLHEGKNRHIRRMLEALGIQVHRLVRVAIGTLQLGDLAKGASRQLTPAEISRLDAETRRPHRTAMRNAPY
jgi:23S rRNA pseudouridine2605 synthase